MPNITEKILNQLRDDITYGKFKPGEHLSEKSLMEIYGVSRVTIRQVITQLASQSYLQFVKNRGAIVTRLSFQDVEIIYNILERCESYATSLFANIRNDELIARLEDLHLKMLDENVIVESKSWLKLNDEFHKVIYLNCGSDILSDLIFHIRQRTFRYRSVVTEPKIIKIYNKQHNKILKAIIDGGMSLAEKSMVDHMRLSRKHRLKTLSKYAFDFDLDINE